MAGSKYSQKAVNKYQKDAYYKFTVTVPKDYKEDIQAAAAARGVSVSRLVCDLLGRELGLDLALTGTLPYLQSKDTPAETGEK